MANRQVIGLSAVVLGIVLAAVLGIRSANSWLSRSTPAQANRDGLVSDNSDSLSRDGAALDSERDRNGQFNRDNESLVSQANNTGDIDDSSDANRPLSPVEEAGTYVQRQQRVEEDAVVANTPVEVIPIANGTPIASQGNTTVDPQPTEPASVPANTTPTTSPSATAPAAANPVPALW